MRQWLYRNLLRLLPAPRLPLQGNGLDQASQRRLTQILRRHHSRAGELLMWEGAGQRAHLLYGSASPRYYRIASISKMLTAGCVMKLCEQGLIDLDRDIGEYLPYPVRNPSFPDAPITLSMLLSHSASIRDGEAFQRALAQPVPAPALLKADSFLDEAPGTRWSYSNFGAGLVACVLEGALGLSFEAIMQQHFFLPLGIQASFYPPRIDGPLADAWRVLPPNQRPNFDAMERKRRPLTGADEPLPAYHYTLAQGNCCIQAQGLEAAMGALMQPGYLSEASLQRMQAPLLSFGERSSHLRQGLGIFVLEDPSITPRTLLGHQGNAYGAVHAAFFEPTSGRGMLFLSEGMSEARREFLADAVKDLLHFAFEEAVWTRTA